MLRDGDKKFRHVLKVKPARLAQSAASATAILSAIAGQAQLDQIEKQLGSISRGVQDIRADVLGRHDAELLGAQRLLGEIYASARASGRLTPSMWDQIAPLAFAVYTLQEESTLRLQRACNKLAELPKTKISDRRERLETVAQEINDALFHAYAEERAVVQFHLLRIWHLAVQRDPSLSSALREIAADRERRRATMRASQLTMNDALANPDVSSILQRIHVRKRRRIREEAVTLQRSVADRTNQVITMPLLGLDDVDEAQVGKEIERAPETLAVSRPEDNPV